MSASALVRSWTALVVLSVATTGLTLVEARGTLGVAVGAGVLLLAGLKARIIVAHYLALSRSRFWMRAFTSALVAFLAVAFAIHLLGSGV